MSPAEQKKRVAAPVAELLKPRGFRKSGLSFTAARDEATLIVALQASTGTTQAILRVTCNVAIQLHRFAAGLRPNVWDAQWHQRIGFFMPERCDHWWTCDSDEAAGRAGREIAALLEASALPEMERLAAPAALACLWRSGRSPGLTDGQLLERFASGRGLADPAESEAAFTSLVVRHGPMVLGVCRAVLGDLVTAAPLDTAPTPAEPDPLPAGVPAAARD